MKLHCWLWGHKMAPMTLAEVCRAIDIGGKLCLVKCSRCGEHIPEPPKTTPWGVYLTPVVLGGLLAAITIWVWS